MKSDYYEEIKVVELSPPFEGGVAGAAEYQIVTYLLPGRGG